MMTWDEFSEKFDKIAAATTPDIRDFILNEFDGKWEALAFGILEMKLYDQMKYNDISYYCTKEEHYAQKVAKAKYLADKLEQLKKEFNED